MHLQKGSALLPGIDRKRQADSDEGHNSKMLWKGSAKPAYKHALGQGPNQSWARSIGSLRNWVAREASERRNHYIVSCEILLFSRPCSRDAERAADAVEPQSSQTVADSAQSTQLSRTNGRQT